MDEEKDESIDSEEDDREGHDVFDVWKEYENIAMHFNDLIIQLRVRALGGIAAISALVGFLSKSQSSDMFRWEFLSVVFGILIIVWLAIMFLDLFYYDRLLGGAVASILQIEKVSKIKTRVMHLNMSEMIEKSIRGELSKQKEGCLSGRKWFYGLVFVALFFSFGFSFFEYVETNKAVLSNQSGNAQSTVPRHN